MRVSLSSVGVRQHIWVFRHSQFHTILLGCSIIMQFKSVTILTQDKVITGNKTTFHQQLPKLILAKALIRKTKFKTFSHNVPR